MAAPALPYFDWRASPFEGCRYRQWTARKSIIVCDTWKQQRQEVEQLSMGDKVMAVTGVVITFRPGVVRMDRDLPDRDLKRGDVILTYTNLKVSQRSGTRAATIPSSTWRLRNGQTVKAAAAHIARLRTLTWVRRHGGPR
jgi:hypothetical protein